MRIYLDNCCYNRPFDAQGSIKVQLESQAKLFVQQQIKSGVHSLVWSYILDYENSMNPYEEKRASISPWRDISTELVYETPEIISCAERLKQKGIKPFDALHIACAISAGCDYYITTDKKLLNKEISEIRIINPVDFVSETEE